MPCATFDFCLSISDLDMEGLLTEIEKLLDVISVILIQLNEIENVTASDVKLILDKSKNEVANIQQSILTKYKQENCYEGDEYAKQEEFSFISQEIDNKDDMKEEYDDFEEIEPYDGNSCTIASKEKDISNDSEAIKINFKKTSRIRKHSVKKLKEKDDLKIEYESSYHMIRKCKQCDYKVNEISDFEEHMENEHFITDRKQGFINDWSHFVVHCKECDFTGHHMYRSDSLRKFIGHFKSKHSDADIGKEVEESAEYHVTRKCAKCDFEAKSISEIRNHLKLEHSTCLSKEELRGIGKLFQCNSCEYSTLKKANMTRHIQHRHSLHNETCSETCHLCGSILKSKTALYNHIRLKHAPEGQTKCDKCGKCFPNENFDGHLCEVEKFICNICGKEYKSNYVLERHTKIEHEGIVFPKPFICDKCDYCCESKPVLLQHLKTHEEKKPCPECGEKVRNLETHFIRVHTPDELKKHQCQDCGKGFHQKTGLEIHIMNVHLKLRPYKCRYGCDISYNDASNRRAHEKKTHGKIFTIVKEEKLKARLQL